MRVTPALVALLKNEMVKRKWRTPADFARATDIDRSTAWAILNGRRKTMDDGTASKISRVLGMAEYELLEKQAVSVVREVGPGYNAEDPLVKFIRGDLKINPEHRPSYEAIATAFGFKKGTH